MCAYIVRVTTKFYFERRPCRRKVRGTLGYLLYRCSDKSFSSRVCTLLSKRRAHSNSSLWPRSSGTKIVLGALNVVWLLKHKYHACTF